MTEPALNLNGYTDIPKGKIAYVVTFLEMTEPPAQPLTAPRQDVRLQPWPEPDVDEYLKLFREVGEDWIWFGRLLKSKSELKALLRQPWRENFLPVRDGRAVGTLEIDYEHPEEPEVAYFGLAPDAIGLGLGRWLMGQALEMAWSRPQTRRVWLHTCTGDSPQAMAFYESCGFRPYRRAIEVADDPRLTGLLPINAGAHVPVLGSLPE